MGIGDILGYLFFFALSFIMIFKPVWFRDFIIFIISIFHGWKIEKEHPFQKFYLILIRIVGITWLVGTINGLLIDMGLTKKEVLREVGGKIKGEIILAPLGLIIGIFAILMGLFGIIIPSKFRSFIWTINKKCFGCIPNENHFYQSVFFYWLGAIFTFIAGLFLLSGILKHYVAF